MKARLRVLPLAAPARFNEGAANALVLRERVREGKSKIFLPTITGIKCHYLCHLRRLRRVMRLYLFRRRTFTSKLITPVWSRMATIEILRVRLYSARITCCDVCDTLVV